PSSGGRDRGGRRPFGCDRRLRGRGRPQPPHGRDKALLPWGTGTLLDHAIRRLRPACREVHILSGSEARYADRGLPVHVDGIADGGPLAGLATALSVATPRSVLLLGVDLPFV